MVIPCLIVVLQRAPTEGQGTLREGVGFFRALFLLLVGATCQRQRLLVCVAWGGWLPLW